MPFVLDKPQIGALSLPGGNDGTIRDALPQQNLPPWVFSASLGVVGNDSISAGTGRGRTSLASGGYFPAENPRPIDPVDPVRSSPFVPVLFVSFVVSSTLRLAVATVHRADLIVSWNFKYMLHIDKIRAYNAVNLVQGYPPIDIRSPREVVPS